MKNRSKFLLVLVGMTTLYGCRGDPPVEPRVTPEIGGRELRPPRAGIEVGSLYYVRETPTNSLRRPANLERLCDVHLARYNVMPSSAKVSDIDLLGKLDADGSLNVVKQALVNVGLSGQVSRYYEYKLVNVTQTDISYQDAQRIFENRAFREDCTAWRENIAGQNWGQYQITAIKTGDIEFARKSGSGLNADLSAKLAKVEPGIKASIKIETKADFSGKGVVVVFSPILRNQAVQQ
ncbi:hypothetical protein [Rhizobium leguminosarum]|uniref:hypothetical protein n=1 Tax=Rhizobium leguminosarum TaxID=384 RepID=UPI001C950A8B|nr:hypothetical protein [Rhizobium leguminosarum]MBY5326529.1 hypothetical protein [Rhizobium leguminosarum]